MLLPAAFGPLNDLYYHLKENVQVWDAAVQRQLEISGKNSARLVQLMTCRIYQILKLEDVITVLLLMIREAL